MKDVARLLNEMVEDGVIQTYAVFGAVAQMRYTEAVATMDADILVGVDDPERLDLLSPIYAYCAGKGFQAQGEAIQVGDWPVQFIPAFDPITKEAMKEAVSDDLDGMPVRVVRADYLAVIALSVGRAKDFARILALRESGSVTDKEMERLAARHGLSEAWRRFKERFHE